MEVKSVLFGELRLHNYSQLADSSSLTKDLFDYFAKNDHLEFLSHLLQYTNELVDELQLELDVDEENEYEMQQINSQRALVVPKLRSICSIIHFYFDLKQYRMEALVDVIVKLHDLLMVLDDSIIGATSLKVAISRICEFWWTKEENGAENMVTQLIPYLLVISLGPTALDADIKRVYNVRGAILLFEFDDPSIESIRTLLLRCYIHPPYLKSAEGKKFLSFLFNISPQLQTLIMSVIKPQLASCVRGLASTYGEIIYKAWKECDKTDSTDSSSIEDVVQGIIHDGIHAADRKYFKAIRLLLKCFHDAKKYKNVDQLLLKCYNPILWRSLKAANCIVRVQAATLFFDTFPLQDPDADINESNLILQKQFDFLTILLKDEDHRVRAVAVSGVCHILREYWEAIPISTTKQILSYIVSTLGCDCACANVRVAVIKGLEELLEQPLSHMVLKGLLPVLANSVHDTNDKVRLAFIQLLIRVKGVRGIHFYHIIPIEHLLSRLTEDISRPAIGKAISKLLVNSYYPQSDGKASMNMEQLRRCLQFIHDNITAAEVFYSNLSELTSVGSVVKLCTMLFSLLNTDQTEEIEQELVNAAVIDDENDELPVGNDTDNVTRAKRGRAVVDTEDKTFKLSDPVIRIGILRILIASLTSVSGYLVNEEYFSLLNRYVNPMSISQVYKRFIDDKINQCNDTLPLLFMIVALISQAVDANDTSVGYLAYTTIIEAYIHMHKVRSSDNQAWMVCNHSVIEVFHSMNKVDVLLDYIHASFTATESGKKSKKDLCIPLTGALDLLSCLIESSNANLQAKLSNSEEITQKIRTIFGQMTDMVTPFVLSDEYDMLAANAVVRCIHVWCSWSIRRYYSVNDTSELSCVIEYMNNLKELYAFNAVQSIFTVVCLLFIDVLFIDSAKIPGNIVLALSDWVGVIESFYATLLPLKRSAYLDTVAPMLSRLNVIFMRRKECIMGLVPDRQVVTDVYRSVLQLLLRHTSQMNDVTKKNNTIKCLDIIYKNNKAVDAEWKDVATRVYNDENQIHNYNIQKEVM